MHALISADWVTPAQVHYFQETLHCFESDSSAQHKNLLIWGFLRCVRKHMSASYRSTDEHAWFLQCFHLSSPLTHGRKSWMTSLEHSRLCAWVRQWVWSSDLGLLKVYQTSQIPLHMIKPVCVHQPLSMRCLLRCIQCVWTVDWVRLFYAHTQTFIHSFVSLIGTDGGNHSVPVQMNPKRWNKRLFLFQCWCSIVVMRRQWG